MPPELDHLSHSSIALYQACARAWKFKYLDGLRGAKTPELAFGTAFHNAVEAFLVNKTLGIFEHSLIDLWLAAWHREAAEGEIEWGLDTPEPYTNDGVRILGHPDVLNQLNGLAIRCDAQGPMIERKIELRVPGVPIPVIGYIDAVQSDGTPLDFKTSAKSWTPDKAAGEMQSLYYLAALNQAGDHSHNWTFTHLVFVKTRTPQVQMYTHMHRPGEVFWLFDMIQAVWQGITAGVFPPNPTSWRCSPRFCDGWTQCRGKYAGG